MQLKLINFDVEPTPPQEEEPLALIIETPEDAKVGEHKKKVDFISDKNALARNPEPNPDLDIDDAYARGDYKSHDLSKEKGVRDEKERKPVPLRKAEGGGEAEKESGAEAKDDPGEKTAAGGYMPVDRRDENGVQDGEMQKNLPSKKVTEETETETDTEAKENSIKGTDILADRGKDLHNMKPVPERRDAGLTPHDHRLTHVIDIGGLSFYTIEGGPFERYLLALEKKIRGNIYPPGQNNKWRLTINGETRLRFKIYQNGKLADLEIVGHKGHESLRITSTNAIELSKPLPRLPPDITQPYKEVNVKIIYILNGGITMKLK